MSHRSNKTHINFKHFYGVVYFSKTAPYNIVKDLVNKLNLMKLYGIICIKMIVEVYIL